MLTIPGQMDWMWFLGCDLDDEIPSTVSLANSKPRGVSGSSAVFLSGALGSVWKQGWWRVPSFL